MGHCMPKKEILEDEGIVRSKKKCWKIWYCMPRKEILKDGGTVHLEPRKEIPKDRNIVHLERKY